MSAVLEDYISQEFDPFLGLMRAQLARPPYLDWQTAVPEGSFVQLRSALPGSPSVESLTADMFVDGTPDLFGDRVPAFTCLRGSVARGIR